MSNEDLPIIMGILNCTPDSFSDGGLFLDADKAVKQALKMHQEGASIIDIGGESTRPNAAPVSADEELSRIVPVIKRIQDASNVKISVDTSKPLVMKQVLDLGVSMINDVNALEEKGAIDVIAKASCQVCLMHKKGVPQSMQDNPHYHNVVEEVMTYLKQRTLACFDKGIDRQRIILDVGFGFGKTPAHNLSLIKQLEKFQALGLSNF